MATNQQNAPATEMKKTLSLSGLTINAMALIAPGAFLWLTFQLQAAQVDPSGVSTAPDIWTGLSLSISIVFLNCRFLLMAIPPLPRRWRRQLILLCSTCFA